jgi:hypothetical protein
MSSFPWRAAATPRSSPSGDASRSFHPARGWRLLACLAAFLALAACTEPPHKEMDQAQGAIDAAAAAGAGRYAEGELAAARDALRLAHDAVADRDYRLALNYALESRERAQAAAREAAETGARVRSEVERAMAAAETGLAAADARLAEVGPKLPRQARERAEAALADIREDLQEAGAAIAADDYLAAQPRLDGRIARLETVMAELDEALASQATPRR